MGQCRLFTQYLQNPTLPARRQFPTIAALRYVLDSDNTGTIADAVSWGKTENGFKNVSAVNPGANQSLARKNLYQPFSDYAVVASAPHNSAMTDLAAAFSQNGNPAPPPIVASPTNSQKQPSAVQILAPPAAIGSGNHRFLGSGHPSRSCKSSLYRLRWFLLSRRRTKPNIYSWRPGLCWL